jgi:hypothetical protein
MVGPFDFTSVNYNNKFEYLVGEFRLKPFVGVIGGSIYRYTNSIVQLWQVVARRLG